MPASRPRMAAGCARSPTRGASFPTVATAAAAASPPWPGSHDADPVPGTARGLVIFAGTGQIGRASCRGGVCRYVLVSVVGWSLTKKIVRPEDRKIGISTYYVVKISYWNK